jgi:signal transduction histidine kinase
MSIEKHCQQKTTKHKLKVVVQTFAVVSLIVLFGVSPINKEIGISSFFVTDIMIKKDNINGKGGEILVSIKDTGTGIASEILPKLFTKFTTKSSIAGGTGLGLFISKSIIEMHGGSIWAFNNDEKNKDERGSTFTFSLPLK